MPIQILSLVIGSNQTEIHKYVIDKYVTPSYGTVTGDPRYDPRADINKDGKVDFTDVTAFAGDAALTFKTFGITPVLWYQVALPVGIGLLAVGAVVLLRRR